MSAQFTHLIPITLAGIVAAALIIERVTAVFFRFAIDSKVFLSKIESYVAQGNIQAALDLCASNQKALLPRVVKSALLKATRDESEIKNAVEISLTECTGLLTQRIGYLAMLANVATLLGLLGTIAGLISSFKAVASADAATKQSLLAEGISVAMNATALGLIVAVPALIAFSLLNGRANKITEELENGAAKTVAMLHGRMYDDVKDDFSKVDFESVPTAKSEIKGAA